MTKADKYVNEVLRRNPVKVIFTRKATRKLGAFTPWRKRIGLLVGVKGGFWLLVKVGGNKRPLYFHPDFWQVSKGKS